MNKALKSKVALVTGGSRSLGAAIAKRLPIWMMRPGCPSLLLAVRCMYSPRVQLLVLLRASPVTLGPVASRAA